MKIITQLNISFLLVGFFPCAALLLLTIFYYDGKLEQMSREHSLEEFNSVHQHFQQNIKSMKNLADLLSKHSDIVTPLELHSYDKLDAVAKEIKQHYQFASIGIIDQHSDLIISDTFITQKTPYQIETLPDNLTRL